MGLGVYGMSRAGRSRFVEFPDLLGDDLFAQRIFSLDERIIVDGTFEVQVPRTLRQLVKVRTRVARGIPSALVYVLVTAYARREARRTTTAAWERDTSTR